MDVHTPETRSYNMSRIRGKDTKPEMIVRRILWHSGFRYRVHYKKLPGKPDLVLHRYNTVIFVHGCFWHRHKGCKYATTPKNRKKFWATKFRNNVKRHKAVIKELKYLGWNIIVVWECETKDIEKLEAALIRSLRKTGVSM